MAISLNDHEDRIKALEQSNSGNSRCVELCSTIKANGEYTINENYTNFDFIVGVANPGGINSSGVMPVKLFPLTSTQSLTLGVGEANQTLVKISFSSATKVNVTWFHNNFQLRLFGLKIYYIFRYNIYNKIIRSIISKISHFFTKIFKYGGEIRDGYFC